MPDLNRRNEFAVQWKPGRFAPIDYGEAWSRMKRGEEVYERVMPAHGVTRAEKAKIPWTLAKFQD